MKGNALKKENISGRNLLEKIITKMQPGEAASVFAATRLEAGHRDILCCMHIGSLRAKLNT